MGKAYQVHKQAEELQLGLEKDEPMKVQTKTFQVNTRKAMPCEKTGTVFI